MVTEVAIAITTMATDKEVTTVTVIETETTDTETTVIVITDIETTDTTAADTAVTTADITVPITVDITTITVLTTAVITTITSPAMDATADMLIRHTDMAIRRDMVVTVLTATDTIPRTIDPIRISISGSASFIKVKPGPPRRTGVEFFE